MRESGGVGGGGESDGVLRIEGVHLQKRLVRIHELTKEPKKHKTKTYSTAIFTDPAMSFGMSQGASDLFLPIAEEW